MFLPLSHRAYAVDDIPALVDLHDTMIAIQNDGAEDIALRDYNNLDATAAAANFEIDPSLLKIKTKDAPCSGKYHLESHRDDCTKFVVCHFSNPQPISCPSGLHFSNPKQVCDLPQAAGCCEMQPYAAGCSERTEGEKSHNQEQSLRKTKLPHSSLRNQNLFGLFKNWLLTA